MKYLYTKDQQQQAHINLSKIFNIEVINLDFDDVYIETIRHQSPPSRLGELNGMFNKEHKQSTKDLISKANKNKVVVMDCNGNTLKVDIDDPRYLSGELIGIAKNKVAVRSTITNETLLVNFDDPRYLSGELIGVNKGKTWKQQNTESHGNKGTFLAKDKHGNMCRLTKNDPRYLSGEYIHFRSKF